MVAVGKKAVAGEPSAGREVAAAAVAAMGLEASEAAEAAEAMEVPRGWVDMGWATVARSEATEPPTCRDVSHQWRGSW